MSSLVRFFVCLFEHSFVVFDMHLKCIMYIVRFTWNISLSIKSPTSVNFRLRLGSEISLKIGIHFDLFLFRLFWQVDFKLHWPMKIGETKKKHCAAQVFLWSVFVHFMTTFSVQFFFLQLHISIQSLCITIMSRLSFNPKHYSYSECVYNCNVAVCFCIWCWF